MREMPRFAAVGLAAIFFVVQICCAPPLRAAAVEASEPMQCPLQKEECETAETKECSGGPQLVSEPPIKKFTPSLEFHPLAVVVREPAPHAEPRILTGWWSTPTRTIQLRI